MANCLLYIAYTVILLTAKESRCQIEETKEIEKHAQNDNLNELTPNNTIEVNSPLNGPEPNPQLKNFTKEVNTTEPKYVACIPKHGSSEVQVVNDTELIRILMPNPNITSKEMPANCVTVLFYSKYCPFSSMAAPHFNALPRAFPDIKMVAINAMIYHLFNTQNGIVGVPSILLFHNGRPLAKFNDSEYTLELFSKFITKYTGIQPKEKSFVTSADFAGPVSSTPTKKTDIFLGLSWAFIVVCAIYYFGKSKYWQWIVETVQNTWRESEAQAQHEHND